LLTKPRSNAAVSCRRVSTRCQITTTTPAARRDSRSS
jgi:hypothetical protein